MISGYRGFAAVMVPSLKERGRTNGWYAAKKAGKRVQDKSLLTPVDRDEKRRERRGGRYVVLLFFLWFCCLCSKH